MALSMHPLFDFRKAAATLAAAALAGSAGTLAIFVLPSLPAAGLSAIPFAMFLSFLIVPVWFVGILVVGYPAWILVHASGLRGRFTATLAGALLAAASSFVFATQILGMGQPPAAVNGWVNGRQTIRNGAYTEAGRSAERTTLMLILVAGAVGGACAGGALQQVAYRREFSQ